MKLFNTTTPEYVAVAFTFAKSGSYLLFSESLMHKDHSMIF